MLIKNRPQPTKHTEGKQKGCLIKAVWAEQDVMEHINVVWGVTRRRSLQGNSQVWKHTQNVNVLCSE